MTESSPSPVNDPVTQTEEYHLTFLRHGQSEGNANGYYQGQADFPLTSTGREQAAALAERWASEGVRFQRIISSPLLRARETAEIIAHRLDAPLELDPTWMEWANGRLEGMSMVEARRKYPRPVFINPYLHIGESGESITELYLRAGRAVQALIDRGPGSYLVVAHGGILNLALKAILGITPQADFQGAHFRFRNTAFARLTYIPAHHEWLLEAVNDQRHWEDRQPNVSEGDYDKD
jgi:2,3-bisphosphoglycerate-dependent phosphoglycerate mutase